MYKLLYDYHTHTVYSHGKGTIADNVKAAHEKGLRGIAISDHGPAHVFYGVKRDKIKAMREEIDKLKSVYPDMEIFLAVEANILHAGNGLDVSHEETSDYDFILAGYHFGVKNGYCIENFLNTKTGFSFSGSKRLLVKNTEMVVKSIYENPIKILTHPCGKARFDISEIAKACADRGTLLEINASHKNLTIEEIKLASKVAGAKFVVSSDAHVPERVGDVEAAVKRAIDAGLDLSRIVNVARL